MSFIKTPVKGMPEYLPTDMDIREYVMRQIKDTYRNYGFSLVETPAIEHIENLTGKEGGENEQLIFKILKRGEKLNEAVSMGLEAMTDSGLRYDLTVPLARFYANNAEKLPSPFKAMQIGPSWRADRPQKGRFRQFTQCDIDILGDETNLAEIELISATAHMLSKLKLGKFKIRINDRRLLRGMALSCAMPEDKLDSVFIILDKMDKIGLEGVKEMLIDSGLNPASVEKYCAFFEKPEELSDPSHLKQCGIAEYIDEETLPNLEYISNMVRETLSDDASLIFDPTLVRGMSYYTGPIFEIELENFHLSVAGGGRYDKMIGKYLGRPVPACGFSIGLERIVTVIKENHIRLGETTEGIAFLLEDGIDDAKMAETIQTANKMRQEGQRVLISHRNKNVKFQKAQLSSLGYTQFIDVYRRN